MKRPLPSLRIDWPLMARILAAVVGGYALTSLMTLLATLVLPLLGVSRAEALHAATMAAFLLYAAIILAVFHASSARRAWACLTGAAASAALMLWALWPGVGA